MECREPKKKRRCSKRNSTQNNSHNYITKIENACIAFFVVFLIMVIMGEYSGNHMITVLGMGIGSTGAVVQLIINKYESEEDEYE